MNGIKIRPYQRADAATILSWCQDEKAFYQWTAGVLGDYPITEQAFSFVESLIPFTAIDGDGVVGFFTLRRPDPSVDELRFGFVIVNPNRRGQGYGKAMLRLGVETAFASYGAKKVSLGVFENNPSAYHCYKAVGFRDVCLDIPEAYSVLGEEWRCKELVMER